VNLSKLILVSSKYLIFLVKACLRKSSLQLTSNSLVKVQVLFDFAFLQSLLSKHVAKMKSHYLNLQSLQLRKWNLILVNVFLSWFLLWCIFTVQLRKSFTNFSFKEKLREKQVKTWSDYTTNRFTSKVTAKIQLKINIRFWPHEFAFENEYSFTSPAQLQFPLKRL